MPAGWQHHPAHRRVQRGKKLVLRHHLRPGQRIKQRRLARVGITNQRHNRVGDLLARPPVQPARPPHVLQLQPQPRNPVADQPPIRLNLRLARPAQKPKAAALALQMGPGAHQPGALILQMRQLDLQNALTGPRPRAKNIQDQPRPVDHFCAPGRLQIPLLHRRQSGIHNNHIHRGLRHRLARQLHLPLAEQGRGRNAAGDEHMLIHHHQANTRRQPHSLGQPRLRRARSRTQPGKRFIPGE